MAGGVTLQVRQIGSYPVVNSSSGQEVVLVQEGGLGAPYAAMTTETLVASALRGGTVPLGVGVTPQPGAEPAAVWTDFVVFPQAGSTLAWGFNPTLAYFVYENAGFGWGSYGVSQMTLSNAGALSLPNGTLTVARDPGAALEVATMGWVGRNTATSFNGRQGAITLNGCDVYSALCLTEQIATEPWVMAAIQASTEMLLANHPFVFGWNGRTGAVYLTLADISCVFFQPGQQPITQTPPLTSNDYSIPNTQWVVEYIANEFAGGGTTLATQQWVLANTVNSFNGRQGVVTLTSSDVFDVGAAPLNSPAFSGIPTAPTAAVGQATGQIATTAFVQQAITNNTAGVSTWNTRTGDVVLEAADVIAVGGLVNPSAGLTGNPTCPTQPPGTNLPVIANCEFVMAAIAAGTVTSFNTRTGAVTLTLADITGVGGAPLVSPAFSSVPTAPTAAPGTNTVQLATTAFVTAAVTAAGGVSSFNSRTGAVTLQGNDISAAGGLVNPSVGLTGSPTATTATAGDNSTRIATTAFVTTALSSGAVSSFNTRTGAVTLQGADLTAAGGALLASPAFTGAPTAPTAAPATNNTQIATTAYVTAAILADTTGVTSFNTRTGAVSLLLADITGAGGAPLASPSFTGVPLGPTATPGTSTTQLATTAFVAAAIASSGVASFNSRTGAVTLIANDISAAGGALLAGPTFTGVPAAPTATAGTNTTQLATTAFVQAAVSALGTGPFLPLVGGTLSGTLAVQTATTTAEIAITGGSAANQQANLTLTGNPPVIFWNYPNVSHEWGMFPDGTQQGNLLVYDQTRQATVLTFRNNDGVCIFNSSILPSVNNNNTFVGYTGQAWAGMFAYAFNNESDPRQKKHIAPVPAGALAQVQAIPVNNFRWISDPDEAPLHWGFLTTDVHAAMGDNFAGWKKGDDPEQHEMLDMMNMIAVLWAAVQELAAKVAAT